MTNLPRHVRPELASSGTRTSALTSIRRDEPVAIDGWRTGLPELSGRNVRLRELVAGDAVVLHALLTSESVDRLISPPPASADAFERFISAMRQGRELGTSACFGIVPQGASAAVGIIQVRQLDPSFRTAEWGFALGAAYWGNGMFIEGARLALDFMFDALGVNRLEARAAVLNGRGNGALRKLGAVQELILRRAFLFNGRYVDQALWTILDTDWRDARMVAGAHTPVH